MDKNQTWAKLLLPKDQELAFRDQDNQVRKGPGMKRQHLKNCSVEGLGLKFKTNRD